jgi:hypothetical protein
MKGEDFGLLHSKYSVREDGVCGNLKYPWGEREDFWYQGNGNDRRKGKSRCCISTGYCLLKKTGN